MSILFGGAKTIPTKFLILNSERKQTRLTRAAALAAEGKGSLKGLKEDTIRQWASQLAYIGQDGKATDEGHPVLVQGEETFYDSR